MGQRIVLCELYAVTLFLGLRVTSDKLKSLGYEMDLPKTGREFRISNSQATFHIPEPQMFGAGLVFWVVEYEVHLW